MKGINETPLVQIKDNKMNKNPYEYAENKLVGKKIKNIKFKARGLFSSKSKISITTNDNFNIEIRCGIPIRMSSKINGVDIDNEQLVGYLLDDKIEEFGGIKMDMNTHEFYDDDSPYSGQVSLKVGKYNVIIWPNIVESIFSGRGNSSPLEIING